MVRVECFSVVWWRGACGVRIFDQEGVWCVPLHAWCEGGGDAIEAFAWKSWFSGTRELLF